MASRRDVEELERAIEEAARLIEGLDLELAQFDRDMELALRGLR